MNDMVRAEPSALETQARAESTAFIRMIERAMAKKDFDVEKLKALTELMEKREAEQARRSWVRAMSMFKSEPLTVVKSRLIEFDLKDGGQTSYRAPDLGEVAALVGPAMAKYGLSFRWKTRREADRIHVECIVMHEDGHQESETQDGAPDTSGKKNLLQQAASTRTYLERYTLMAICGLAAHGQDDDGAGGAGDEPVDVDPEQDAIDDLYAKIGISESKAELAKLRDPIQAIQNAAKRRNLIGAWNAKNKEFAPPQTASNEPG